MTKKSNLNDNNISKYISLSNHTVEMNVIITIGYILCIKRKLAQSKQTSSHWCYISRII